MAILEKMFGGKMVEAIAALALAAALAGAASGALAQEVTLKLHQFLPAQANVPTFVLDVWADNVERDSGGRIKVDRYPSMQLGGAPAELYQQTVDGIADVVWTAPGYTPGRFPRAEVLELPFMVRDARAGSYALWTMYEEGLMDDLSDTHLLGAYVHGPGVIHTADPVMVPADLRGMKIRGASRQVNALLAQLGAEPLGMPAPAIPEALSKGVLDGTTLPWEVTTSLRIPELVDYHTEFTGPNLYTLAFFITMNKAAYDALPADLQAVIDANSGLDLSLLAANVVLEQDAIAREMAVDNGNEVVRLDNAQSAVWADVAAPVRSAWLADMQSRGIDGQALIDRAEALMADYEGVN